MATKRTKSELETLEQSRVALENLDAQPEISAVMSDLGFGPEERTIGNEIYQAARTAYNANQIEDDETSVAYNEYVALKDQLDSIYSTHRKKAKVIFRNDHTTADRLGITGSIPQAYLKWLDKVRKFYSVCLADEAIQTKLMRLKVSGRDLAGCNTLIDQVDTTRSKYLSEKGESQTATQIKDEALAKLDDWMSEFYAIAKIGLEDKPQLLESLGKLVRN